MLVPALPSERKWQELGERCSRSEILAIMRNKAARRGKREEIKAPKDYLQKVQKLLSIHGWFGHSHIIKPVAAQQQEFVPL